VKRRGRLGSKSARETLSKGAPRVYVSPIIRWLRDHPAALGFVKTYLEMLNAGETEWSSRMVVEHLRREHGYPFKDGVHFIPRVKAYLAAEGKA